MVNPENWSDVDEGRAYKAPKAIADHLKGIKVRSEILSRAHALNVALMVLERDASQGSPQGARGIAEFVGRKLPNPDESGLIDLNSERIATAAMVVARDGDDGLLDEYESWVREVMGMILANVAESHRLNRRLKNNAAAISVLCLVHLWRRRRLKSDRDAMLMSITRSDRCALPAFEAAAYVIEGIDPRVLKSSIRIGLQTSRWRWSQLNDDAENARAYRFKKSLSDLQMVQKEIDWLEGGVEPVWAKVEPELPKIKRSPTFHVSNVVERNLESEEELVPRNEQDDYFDHQASAPWLSLISRSPPPWTSQVVIAYEEWTATMNGLGQSADSRVSRAPTEWNLPFYTLVANQVMDADPVQADGHVRRIEGLPDRAFCDVAEIILFAADVAYFNHAERLPQRLIELRTRIVSRTATLRGWGREHRYADLSIDRDMAGVVARLLMNTNRALGASADSYLVAAVFDRVDPILPTLLPMMSAGPTPFIGMCTMNTLMVAPKARHVAFTVSAVEGWLLRMPNDMAAWTDLPLGRMIVNWFVAAIEEDPTLLSDTHQLRGRMDGVFSHLISLGVAEAHDLEIKVAASNGSM